jgi:hypothetical protein
MSGGDSTTNEAAGPRILPFQELVVKLREDKQIAPDLWIMFDAAHVAAYRGREEEASFAYRKLRDRIEWEKSVLSAQGTPIPEVLTDTANFVTDQLAGDRLTEE